MLTHAIGLPKAEHLQLCDGTPVTIRPICADDAPRLQAFHFRLSPQSIYRRFLGAHPVLTRPEAEKLANVDFQRSLALVATAPLGPGGQELLIGVARYCRLEPAQPDEAEMALVVEDKFQGRGLGTLLAQRLTTCARKRGIHTFVAFVATDNEPMLKLIQRSGLPTTRHWASDQWDIRVKL